MITSLIGLAILLAIVLAGVPLGFALILVGVIGFAYVRADMVGQALLSWGDAGLVLNWRALNAASAMAGQQIFDISTSYTLTVIPLFVLMGALITRANLASDLYTAANAFVGHFRGGLAMGTIAACGGFGAVCGSSLATAATIAKVAMPSMRRYNYADSLSTGSIAAGGTLGIMIPPSVPMVLYGLLSETDIAKLFIAGILPGLLLIVLFWGAILLVTARNPAAGPPGDYVPWARRGVLLWRVWGVLAIFVIIIGGIYIGAFTPTEAAGVGVFAAALFAWGRGRLTFQALRESLVETGVITGMIFIVSFGALIFANFINLAGFTGGMTQWLVDLQVSPITIILVVCVIFILMGCIFDSLSILILTVPALAAILKPLGVDMVWFGIVMVITVELGLITPPVGLNVFVVKSVLQDVNVWTIFRGVWPFVGAMLIALGLILAFPQIAVWLPNLMMGT